MTFSFWKRENWKTNPVSSMIFVALSVAILLWVIKFLAGMGAGSVMETLDVEDKIHDAVMDAAGSEEVAEYSLMSPFPSACEKESAEQRTVRIHGEARCINRNCQPGETDAEGNPIDCADRVAGYLESAGTTEDDLKSDIQAIAEDESTDDELKGKMGMRLRECPKDDTFQDLGPTSTACNEGLNDSVPYPSKAREILNKLYELELDKRAIVKAAQAIARPDPQADKGWAHVPGGNALRPLSLGRSDLDKWRNSPPGNLPEGETPKPLTLDQRRGWAKQAVDLEKSRDNVREEVAEGVRTAGYGYFTWVLEQAATHLLFFALIMILWGGFVGLGGWRRWLAGFALGALSVGFLAPQALTSLGLESAGAAGGSSESFNSLVGAPFALLAMILDFFQNTIASVGDPDTQRRILLAALFAVIFFAGSKLALFTAAYGLLVVPAWINSGEFSALPWNLDAFDVALFLPIVAWVGHALAILLAVPVARGVWHNWGNRLVAKGNEIMAQTGGSTPAPAGPAPAADATTPNRPPVDPGATRQL